MRFPVYLLLAAAIPVAAPAQTAPRENSEVVVTGIGTGAGSAS